MLRSDSLQRQKFAIKQNTAFFATSEDLGMVPRSSLFVFDIANKSFIQDTSFKRDHLVSSAAVFIEDSSSNKIFSVSKAQFYEAKGLMIIPASLYDIDGKYFRFIKKVYQIGKEVPEVPALLTFFRAALGGKNDKVSPLPADWRKSPSQ